MALIGSRQIQRSALGGGIHVIMILIPMHTIRIQPSISGIMNGLGWNGCKRPECDDSRPHGPFESENTILD